MNENINEEIDEERTRPVIGITVSYDPFDVIASSTKMGLPGQDHHFVAGDYVRAIARAGGAPILIPCADEKIVGSAIDALDGVVITGGNDVDPLLYGERIGALCGSILPTRDRADTAAIRWAIERGKPLLGICRGMQLLNVALGGTLYQDLERDGGYLHHFLDAAPRYHATHEAIIEKESWIGGILGTSAMVNSFHHQGARDIAPNAHVVARSPDGVVEAIEAEERALCVGVQWHPEMMFDSEPQAKIFSAFVDACR